MPPPQVRRGRVKSVSSFPISRRFAARKRIFNTSRVFLRPPLCWIHTYLFAYHSYFERGRPNPYGPSLWMTACDALMTDRGLDALEKKQ